MDLQTNYQNLEDLKCSLEMIFNNYNKYVKNLNVLDANLFLADKDYKKLETFLTRDLKCYENFISDRIFP